MIKFSSIYSLEKFAFALILLGLLSSIAIGYSIGKGDPSLNQTEILVTFLIGLSLLILIHPHLGIILVIISLPVVDIIPRLPYISSAVTLVGGVTLGGFLLQRYLWQREKMVFLPSGLLMGFLFILWVFISNPLTALISSSSDRNWMFTFAQLFILAWLAAQLLDSPEKHHLLMWLFSIATIFSAIYAIQQGVIDDSIQESIRAKGLAGGANTAARYFTVAFAFMYFLMGRTEKNALRIFLAIGMAIVLLGLIKTISRTGLLLIVGTIGMLFILQVEGRRQKQALLVFTIFIGVVWVFSDQILSILRSIFPAIQQGTDTIGLRYGLWEAGIRMWQDHLVNGVGIGNYSKELFIYGIDLLPYYQLQLGAHNMYIQVLAETGLVGVVLFLSFIFMAIRSFWINIKLGNTSISSLAKIWLVALVIMILGGVTKHDHYDKLLWMTIGISMCRLWSPTNILHRREKPRGDTLNSYNGHIQMDANCLEIS